MTRLAFFAFVRMTTNAPNILELDVFQVEPRRNAGLLTYIHSCMSACELKETLVSLCQNHRMVTQLAKHAHDASHVSLHVSCSKSPQRQGLLGRVLEQGCTLVQYNLRSDFHLNHQVPLDNFWLMTFTIFLLQSIQLGDG